jgi:hypothetical protein
MLELIMSLILVGWCSQGAEIPQWPMLPLELPPMRSSIGEIELGKQKEDWHESPS